MKNITKKKEKKSPKNKTIMIGRKREKKAHEKRALLSLEYTHWWAGRF